MSEHNVGLSERGKPIMSGASRTLTAGMRADLEGLEKMFVDKAPGQTGAQTKRSDRPVHCRLVQNVSGINLEPKRIVKYASGFFKKRVDGYCNVDNEQVAGIVDEHYPASGVPNNEYFWATIGGPSLVKTSLAGDGENVIGLGDYLLALTAATSQATTAGRLQAFGLTATSTATTNGTLINQLLHQLGQALSAKTTANTNADVLVDVQLMK